MSDNPPDRSPRGRPPRRDPPRRDPPRRDPPRRDPPRRDFPRRDFPRRDPHGRVAGLGDLLALVAAGLVTGLAVLAAIDGVMVLLGMGTFGGGSGWLSLILPAWLFILEEFRAWRPVSGRLAVATSGALIALVLGLATASLTAGLPPLLSGGVGAAVTSAAYAVYWYHGVRWLARREGSLR